MHLWISQVKLHSTQASWDEATLMAQASAALEGPTAMWLHTTKPDILFQFNQFKEELQRSFSPLSQVDLLKEYLQCAQDQGKSVCNFYHCMLMLQKRAGLKDNNLLTSHFHKGLQADLHQSMETLLNSSTITKLKEQASKFESRLHTTKPVCMVTAVPLAEEHSTIQEVHEEMQDLREDMHNVVAWVQAGPEQPSSCPMAEVQCYNCHGWGHFAHNCPKGRELLKAAGVAPAASGLMGGTATVQPPNCSNTPASN